MRVRAAGLGESSASQFVRFVLGLSTASCEKRFGEPDSVVLSASDWYLEKRYANLKILSN